MKKPTPRSLTIAIALATMVAIAAPAWAQQDFGVTERKSMREKRDAARAAKKAQKQEVVQQYPQATRQDPETAASRAGLKKLQKLQEAFQADDTATTLALAAEIYQDPDSNVYEKAFAYLVAGNTAANEGDNATAADMFAQALATEGLDNNNHYNTMFNLAATLYGEDKYEESLKVLDRFLSETKADKPEADDLRGALLMSLDRYDEAAQVYTAILEKDPGNGQALMNAVSAYQSMDQMEKAAELLAKAQAGGHLTDANGYRALYVTYINDDRDAEALAVIKEGLEKGILTPNPQLARDYMVLGQRAYYNDDDATAIEMYKQAASMSDNGEAALNLAKIYAEAGRKEEARAAAQEALDKGVKAPDEARKLLGGG
ncbi:MAG TPA: tetratricopeptide repeat protein [Luteimonas sp.]|nr:tetratricopeptide repeat protein [Luteimonas sp.]